LVDAKGSVSDSTQPWYEGLPEESVSANEWVYETADGHVFAWCKDCDEDHYLAAWVYNSCIEDVTDHLIVHTSEGPLDLRCGRNAAEFYEANGYSPADGWHPNPNPAPPSGPAAGEGCTTDSDCRSKYPEVDPRPEPDDSTWDEPPTPEDGFDPDTGYDGVDDYNDGRPDTCVGGGDYEYC
jgi:hypothetical protein